MNRFEVGQKTATLRRLRQDAALARAQMDAMAEEGFGAEQAAAGVNIRVIARPGEQFAHERDLGPVLREVGLDVTIPMLSRERAGGLELGFRRGDREARSDGVKLAPAPVPFADQRLRLIVAALGRIAQGFGRVAIHQHLARDHERVAPLRFREEGIGRLRMHRAERARGRRAVAQQLVEEETRNAFAMRRVRKPLFLDEGVFVQPIEQLRRRSSRSPGFAENGCADR